MKNGLNVTLNRCTPGRTSCRRHDFLCRLICTSSVSWHGVLVRSGKTPEMTNSWMKSEICDDLVFSCSKRINGRIVIPEFDTVTILQVGYLGVKIWHGIWFGGVLTNPQENLDESLGMMILKFTLVNSRNGDRYKSLIVCNIPQYYLE